MAKPLPNIEDISLNLQNQKTELESDDEYVMAFQGNTRMSLPEELFFSTCNSTMESLCEHIEVEGKDVLRQKKFPMEINPPYI